MQNIPGDPQRHDVFCGGALLHTVQTSRVFEDSKTFVDMKMKHSPKKIFEKFHQFIQRTTSKPSREEVRKFVDENFEKSEVELSEWHPEDWKEKPETLMKINVEEYRNFGFALHQLWKDLGRKISKKCEEEIDCSSLIWVPKPFVVPGGRFREFYYWDTYWIIRGLLVSEMYETTKGMLDNFLHIIEEFGYIPNGGRIYYLGRSQPPTFIPSFKAYIDATNDLEYLKKNITLLEKEFQFWTTRRMKVVQKEGKEYILAAYSNSSEGPRPESYVEDFEASQTCEAQTKTSFYNQIKAACESGMDFTSRWFVPTKGTLKNIKTTRIIPVDLNAMLYRNAVILSEFNEMLQNQESAAHFKDVSEKLLDAITSVFWQEDLGIWLDFDLENETRRNDFYASNLTPLWAGCYDDAAIEKVLHHLEETGVLDYPGGVPQSLEDTGEQWDFPNAWPPTQHMIIFGLKRTDHPKAQQMAKNLAEKWLTTNHRAFLKTGHMAEKYDASCVGHSGGGGEYKVQFGFGWTNGVILDILANFYT